MTAISAATSSIGGVLAQLIAGDSGSNITSGAAGANPAASLPAASTDNSGPATFLTLSDQAKAAAAAKAQSDQTAAETLQAYVEAHRVNGSGAPSTGTTDTTASETAPNTSSKIEAIVAQIKTLTAANEPQPFQSFTPTKSISNSVTVDGFTLSLSTNASTQFYGIQLSGNGVSLYNKHFGPSAGVGGGSQLPPGTSVTTGIPGNNDESIDAITVTQNLASASSTSVSASSAGSVSTASLNAQSSSITFLVNYATGAISVQQSAASVSARSSSVGSTGSTLSTLA